MHSIKASADGSRTRGILVAAAALLLAAAACAARAADLAVTAALQPAEIGLGEAAQLTVTCNGQRVSSPQIAPVDGLSFRHAGQSSQFQFINGAMSSSVTHTFLVIATKPGTYTIPPVAVTDGRETAQSQPLALTVRGGPSGQAMPQAAPANPGPQAAPQAHDPPAEAGETEGVGFLRMVVPRAKLYMGETVPVRLEAFLREGIELRVDAPPKFNSEAFTMNKLGDKPERHRELVNGIPCAVLVWPTTITAVKAGDHKLVVEMPTTVAVRVQARRPSSRSRGLFSDPFFDDFFNGAFSARTEAKQVPLTSEPMAVTVAPLPAEGRPAGFSGAVGQFDISAEAAPTSVAAGDPVTLKVNISGEGNFDRVSLPGVERGGAWKSYQPSTSFEPGNGLAGEKRFEQALVPLQSGKLEIPALEFSYFDPTKETYVTRATNPMTIEVAPGANPMTQAAAAGAGTPQTPASPAPADELLPDKVELGPVVHSLGPWFLRPGGLALGLSPSLAALAGWWLLAWRRRRGDAPERRIEAETRRFVRRQMEIMRDAAAHGAAPEFFSAARDALRQRLAARWGVPAQAITLAEVDARRDGGGEEFRQIFELADEAVFAGSTFAPEQLDAWRTVVEAELKKLEAK